MSRSTKFVLFVSGLLLVAILFPIIARPKDGRYQPEFQAKVLSHNFEKVQLQNGRVLLTPRDDNSMMRTSDNERFRQPELFFVGSQFKAYSRHWGATYTINGIKSDGVVIEYSSGEMSNTMGTIKLAWKP